MTIRSFLVKNVLQTYDKHLDTARKLARINQTIKSSNIKDDVTISREARRRQMVERIAREIVDSLLTSGSDNPVVKDIHESLEHEIGEKLVFSYPPMEDHLKILKKTEHGTYEVNAAERERILSKLWGLALSKVDETML